MVGDPLRGLWAEPRPERPPVRVWRDWTLLGVLVVWSVLEALLREDLAWRPVALAVGVVVALTLLWRRTHPLAAVVAAFGVLTATDVARILATNENGLLWSISGVLVLPYSLFRWGAGREAGIGLGVILAWLAITHVADPTDAGEVVAGYGFFLFSAALGASIRFHANARIRDIEQAKLRQRNQLARELHIRSATTCRLSPSRPRRGHPGGLPPRPCREGARDHRGSGVADAGGDARHGGRPA
jgi:hypothetical protein